MDIFTFAKGYAFTPVHLLVGLSVCQQDYTKSTGLIFMKKGLAWAKEEPIQFGSGSESQGGSPNYFSISLTLQDKAFGPSGDLHSPSAHTVPYHSKAIALLCLIAIP